MLDKNNLYDGVYGLAIGDALGVPVEFTSREERDKDPVTKMRAYGTHNQPVGTWSDDTSMVLATMDAMCRGLNYGTVMDCFIKWVRDAEYTAGGAVFDIGGTTYKALNAYHSGADLDKCGADDVFSNGNGSLMRMLPMIYYVQEKWGVNPTDIAISEIYRLSGLTHAHIISKMCCVYYVYIGIYIKLFGERAGLQKCIKDGIEAVDEFYSMQSNVPSWEELIKKNSLTDSVELDRLEIKSTGYVVDSLEASIWCLYNTSSYKEAVLKAVNLGEDTDTVGAITGSLAGLYYGLNGIPKEWINSLQNKEFINSICDRFYEQYK